METIRTRFQWNHGLILEFIRMIRDNHLELYTGIKKNVYTKIADQINKNHEMNLTWDQCESKWRALLRQYNVTKLYNNTRGNQIKNWRYYDYIEEILILNPEIRQEDTDSYETDMSDTDTSVKVPTNVDERNTKRSRRDIEQENTEKYRKAKLQIMERFTTAFEKFVEYIITK